MARKGAILFPLAIALLAILQITDTFAEHVFQEKMLFKRDAYHNEETSVSYPSSSDSYAVYENEAPSHEYLSVSHPSDSYTAHEYEAPEYTAASHEYLSASHPSSSSDSYSVNEYEVPEYTAPSYEPDYPEETTTYTSPAAAEVQYSKDAYPGVASQYPLDDLAAEFIAQEEKYAPDQLYSADSLTPYQLALVHLLLKSASDYSPPTPYGSPYVAPPYASPPPVYGQFPVYQQPRPAPYTPPPQPNYQSPPSYINSQSSYRPIPSY